MALNPYNSGMSDPSEPPILSYQSHAFSPLVTVRSFYSATVMPGYRSGNEFSTRRGFRAR